MDVSLCSHSLLLHCTEALCSCLHCSAREPGQTSRASFMGISSDSCNTSQLITEYSVVAVAWFSVSLSVW